jgi:hypothetical protein
MSKFTMQGQQTGFGNEYIYDDDVYVSDKDYYMEPEDDWVEPSDDEYISE